MPIYEVISRPVDGPKKFKDATGAEREYIRITTGEFEDEATARVRVNDRMAQWKLHAEIVKAAVEDPAQPDVTEDALLHEDRHRLYKVTKVREV